ARGAGAQGAPRRGDERPHQPYGQGEPRRAGRSRKEGPAGCGQPPRGGEVTMARNPDLCVVTCALTGVLADRKHCPSLPYTPAEIGEEARRAYEAGAAVVHIHARNDDG